MLTLFDRLAAALPPACEALSPAASAALLDVLERTVRETREQL